MDADKVFKALGDPTRRRLLDLLCERNGQTLGELCDHLDMARQSATQHIGILEAANLVGIVLAWRGDIVAQQKGSAMIFALSAALYGRVDIEASAVPQGTFNDRQPSA